jgi:plastocyanin
MEGAMNRLSRLFAGSNEGVFSYNCALHPNMKGSVEVKK